MGFIGYLLMLTIGCYELSRFSSGMNNHNPQCHYCMCVLREKTTIFFVICFISFGNVKFEFFLK